MARPKPETPAPPSQYRRKVSPSHLPMMQRIIAHISQNDLHRLTTMEPRELRALLDLVRTAKNRRLDLATLLEEHNRHCTGQDRN